MSPSSTPRDQLDVWLKIIKREYCEMPGLHLTKGQIRRLWGLDESMCDALVEKLQNMHFLRMTSDGGYVLDAGPWAAPGSASRRGLSRALKCD